MAKPKNSEPRRAMVEVDPVVADDFDSILEQLGGPKKITVATAALRHITQRVKNHELVFTNGEFQNAKAA